MEFLERVFTKAARSPRHIVLPEGEDGRVLDAAVAAVNRGLAQITLLGDKSSISAGLRERRAEDIGIGVIEPSSSRDLERYGETYLALRAHRNITRDEALSAAAGPLEHAALMVRLGDADGTIGGAVFTTAETIRTALQIVGTAPDVKLVSSFMIMVAEEPHHPLEEGAIFADCALVVEPTAEELAEIAVSSGLSAKSLLGVEPSVALLSFSTSGSGFHPRVDLVKNAVVAARKACPEMLIEGEMQFDAAIDPAIRLKKAGASKLGSSPSVFVFPNLDAGNIGYKLAERIGRMKAIGPVLQGLAKPANDLSRGCSADDILNLVAVSVIQAQTAVTALR